MQKITRITLAELTVMATKMYGDLVKAVVDVRQRTMAVDAEMHSDEEAYLLELGSQQRDLWGINLYPDSFGTADFVEFDSMINLRPGQGNRSRSVENAEVQALILEIVGECVHA